MQDTFQWNDALVLEFAREYHEKLTCAPTIVGQRFGITPEQFKASKAPKKEWEIVALRDTYYGGLINQSNKLKIYRFEDYLTNRYPAGRFVIHSVRRLSDGEVFSVGDRIKPNAAHHPIIITQFTATEKTLRVHNKDGYFLSGEQYWEQMRKAPAPIFVTVDGVEIKIGDVFWSTDEDFNLAECKCGESTKECYANRPTFSTREAAEDYILNHKPVLSLNGVREWVEAAIRSNLSMDFILEKAEHTVKQKLNPDNLKK